MTTSLTATASLPMTTRSTATRPSFGTTGRGALVGGAAAVTGSLAVLAVANIGAPVQVITGWAPNGADLTVAETVITTIVSVALAAAGLGVLDRVTTRSFRIWSIAVAIVTVLSFVPLWGLAVDTGSKVALTVMHLVVGAATVAGQVAVRRAAR